MSIPDEPRDTSSGKADRWEEDELFLYRQSTSSTLEWPAGEAAVESRRFRIYDGAVVQLALVSGIEGGFGGKLEVFLELPDGTSEPVGGIDIDLVQYDYAQGSEEDRWRGHDPDMEVSLRPGMYRVDSTAEVPWQDTSLEGDRVGTGRLIVTCSDVGCIPPDGCAFGHVAERLAYAHGLGTASVPTRLDDLGDDAPAIVRAQFQHAIEHRAAAGEDFEAAKARARTAIERFELTLRDGRRYDVVTWNTEDRVEAVIFELGTTRVVADTAERDLASDSCTELRIPASL